MYKVERIIDQVMASVERMDSQQWLVISAVAVVMGAMLLRGFGSRTSY